ncbi:MAG: hypothetical protein M3N29_00270 [Chloroflexota bacterium]|nr:hypothetical protein [Chloroflexota bacterium]
MEALLVIVLIVIVFALGPVVAFLDILSRELFTESGLSGSRLLKALFFLFVPLSWIVYFLFIRRRRPFA